ncbi:hypothetical protein TL16_g04144 [Triparma laevis f. inornata]|uniref:PNPLA domain-containing protein n=1 Tax=Triparma laevis f. inornata TaxID=1714386 RepID=A0A9W7A3L6_9STRA|nr:hypothetical protein TL16_g04144 [Triparma laevis f. inornata]
MKFFSALTAQLVSQLLGLLVGLTTLVATSSASDVDDAWKDFLVNPPSQAVEAANELQQRADGIANNLSNAKLAFDLTEIDVVCSGGGNFDAFYMGASMVLSRLSAAQANVQRYAGVSAGGMMPFEIALKGETTTLESHLSYGVLSAEYAASYKSALEAMYLEDHHWRIMASWQTETYADQLADSLNNKVFVGTSCLTPLPKLIIISEYTASDDQATHAFMSTGTYDGRRPQLIVDLMATGFPSDMVYRVDFEQYKSLIEVGMDEMEQFLREGKTSDERPDIITLCDVGSDVSSNVCK